MRKIDEGMTPLATSIKMNHPEVSAFFYKQQKIDINAVGQYGTALTEAAVYNNLTEARALILAGADVNLESPDHEFTPLSQAVRRREYEMVKLLLDHKARTDVLWSNQFTLMATLELGYDSSHSDYYKTGDAVKIATLLSAHGVPSEGRTEQMIETPLQMALQNRDNEMVQFFASHVSNIDEPSGIWSSGNRIGGRMTALMSAAFESNAFAVRLLLEKGANPAVPDVNGATAFDYYQRNEKMQSLYYSHRSIVEYLSRGKTHRPCHRAVIDGNQGKELTNTRPFW